MSPSRTVAALLLLVAIPGWVAAEMAAGQGGPPSPRSWLGVWLGDTDDGGVRVVALVPGGPSALAGMKAGDIILQANDVELTGQDQLRGLLGELPPGEPLRLIVMRDGKPVETRVTTGERPGLIRPRRAAVVETDVAAAGAQLPALANVLATVDRVESRVVVGLLGLRAARITPALRQHYGAPPDAGVLVTVVEPEKLADLAEVEVGDVLVELGGRKIVQPGQIESTLLTWNRNRPLRASLVRDRKSSEVVLVPAAHRSTGVRSELEAARQAWRQARRVTEEQKLRLEIEQLEQRLEQLKRELERLEGDRP
jgi:S1-C subfamily serine protease